MASTDSPVGAAASILAAVKAQTLAVQTFMSQQVGVFTGTGPTTQVTDADGNPYTVPTWNQIQSSVANVQSQVTALANASQGGGTLVLAANQVGLAVPFGLVNNNDTLTSTDAAGTLSPDGLTVTLNNAGTGGTTDAIIDCISAGQFPSDGGKYWFIVENSANAQINSGNQDGIQLYFTTPNPAGGNDLTLFQIVIKYASATACSIGVAATVAYNAPVPLTNFPPHTIAAGAANNNLLVTIDMTANTVTIYADTQVATFTIGSMTPALWGKVCMEVSGSVYTAGASQTLAFDVTDATKSITAVPTGFNPMTNLYGTAFPSKLAAGEFLYPEATAQFPKVDSAYNQVTARAGQLYFYDGTALSTVPLGLTVSLSAINTWGQPQVINGALYGSYFQDESDIFIGANYAPQSQAFISGLSGPPVPTAPPAGYVGQNNFATDLLFLRGVTSALSNVIVGTSNSSNSYPPTLTSNTAVGSGALLGTQMNLQFCSALGANALSGLIDSSGAAGSAAAMATAYYFTAVGANAAENVTIETVVDTSGNHSTPQQGGIFIGYSAGGSSTLFGAGSGANPIVLGMGAASYAQLYLDDIAIGPSSMYNLVSAGGNGNSIAMGSDALYGANLGTAVQNLINIGYEAGYSSTFLASPTNSDIFIGASAGAYTTSAGGNIGIGDGAFSHMTSATGNTQNTVVGHSTLNTLATATANVTALGYQATVTGSNQVQLGNSSTTTYTYGAVQNRSDVRDKAEIRDTVLGLDFIKALRPVDFKWDMREDYVDHASRPVMPRLRPEPVAPKVELGSPEFMGAQQAHAQERLAWLEEKKVFDAAFDRYQSDLKEWKARNALGHLQHDGTKKRDRFHHGVIAQEVKAQADKLGVDFGGYQDHEVNGGEDVKSIGYEEFIGPMIKAIQEVDAKFTSKEHINLVVDAVIMRLSTQPAVLDKIAEAVAAQIAAKMNPPSN